MVRRWTQLQMMPPLWKIAMTMIYWTSPHTVHPPTLTGPSPSLILTCPLHGSPKLAYTGSASLSKLKLTYRNSLLVITCPPPSIPSFSHSLEGRV